MGKDYTITFIYEKFFLGGAETLIYRMSKWLVEKKYDVEIVFREIDEELKKICIESKINLVPIKKFTASNYYKATKAKNNQQLIVTFFVVDFILAEQIKKKSQKDVKTILYVVHPYILINKYFSKNKVGIIFKSAMKKLVLKMYNSKSVYFMDEDCINVCSDYYKINLKKAYNEIIRLPMYLRYYRKKKKNPGQLKVLSISRIDFPFKGYLLGLIDAIEKLNDNNIKLTIIGDGPDRSILEKKIEKSTMKHNINYVGAVPYNRLDSHFKNSDLYIGMGTTVLDAVSAGTPAICVYSYTLNFKVTGFFYEAPHVLGGIKEGETYPCLDGVYFLEKVNLMNDCQYQALIDKGNEVLKKIYNIDLVMPAFLKNVLDGKNKNNKLLAPTFILWGLRKIQRLHFFKIKRQNK